MTRWLESRSTRLPSSLPKSMLVSCKLLLATYKASVKGDRAWWTYRRSPLLTSPLTSPPTGHAARPFRGRYARARHAANPHARRRELMTTATVQRAESPPSGELSHRQILTILVGLLLGMFLAALDQTVVSTAIRTIADDLGGLSEQAWATTAFLITSTITTPLYGKLSDIYGRKPFFLVAISIFLVGSITCTFAQSMYQLAAFRALQGIGAGGLFSLALTILGDIVPPRERARYQGLFLAVFGTSSVLGPVIGGLLSGANDIMGIAGWRWIFLVNVPIGLVALVVVAKVL